MDIAGATNATYTLTQAEVGKVITVVAVHTDALGTVENPITSAATTAVANVNDETTGSVTIDGVLSNGEELTVNTSALADNDGIGTYTYQWQADGVDIAGATDTTYTLTQNEIGKVITVVVVHTDALGTVEDPITSEPTVTVTLPLTITIIAVDDIINLAESTATTLSGQVEPNSSVKLTMGGNERTATVNGNQWSYDLVADDITAMGEGEEQILVNAQDVNNRTYTTSRSISIDTTRPEVNTVEISGTDADGNAKTDLKTTDKIKVTVTFSETVLVDGNPTFEVLIGNTSKLLAYQDGHNTNTLTFEYAIVDGDLDDEGGITTQENTLLLNGGSINDGVSNPADLSISAIVTDTNSIGVDTTAPEITDVTIAGEYATGDPKNRLTIGDFIVVLLDMSEEVIVSGTPQFTINVGGVTKVASYVSGSGTNQLKLQYAIILGDGDLEDGITAQSNALTLNGGSLNDAAGNISDISTAVIPEGSNIVQVNTDGPEAHASQPITGFFVENAYEVQFNKNINFSKLNLSDVSIQSGNSIGTAANGARIVLDGDPNEIKISGLDPMVNGVYKKTPSSGITVQGDFTPDISISSIDPDKPLYFFKNVLGETWYLWPRFDSGYHISRLDDTSLWYWESVSNPQDLVSDPSLVQNWKKAMGDVTPSTPTNSTDVPEANLDAFHSKLKVVRGTDHTIVNGDILNISNVEDTFENRRTIEFVLPDMSIAQLDLDTSDSDVNSDWSANPTTADLSNGVSIDNTSATASVVIPAGGLSQFLKVNLTLMQVLDTGQEFLDLNNTRVSNATTLSDGTTDWVISSSDGLSFDFEKSDGAGGTTLATNTEVQNLIQVITYKNTASSITSGERHVHIEMTNSAGEKSTVRITTIFIDLIAPTLTITLYDDPNNVNDASTSPTKADELGFSLQLSEKLYGLSDIAIETDLQNSFLVNYTPEGGNPIEITENVSLNFRKVTNRLYRLNIKDAGSSTYIASGQVPLH